MTDTDTPREPLTAEQIAGIEERNKATRFVLDANYEREPPWWYRCHEAQLDGAALLASHAALRDRLARAEARERELAEAAAAFLCEVTRYENTSLNQRLDMSEGERKTWRGRRRTTANDLRIALAAPTDGTAPPRCDEGETR